jgi:hypothetical protein
MAGEARPYTYYTHGSGDAKDKGLPEEPAPQVDLPSILPFLSSDRDVSMYLDGSQETLGE